MKKIFILLFAVSFFAGCNNDLKQKGNPSYIKSIESWHNKRISNLKKENGWLNLVGLFWLKEGNNTFGSAKTNDIVFPGKNVPGNIGTFILKDSVVTAEINPNVNVTVNDSTIKKAVLKNDLSGNPTVLSFGNLRWFVIKRGDQYGIRLRDLNAPLLTEFKGIKTFPINEDWRVEAEYHLYEKPKVLSIPTVLNTVEEDTAYGYLSFNLQGKDYTLDPLTEGNEFFIIFADETNGKETYGAGRFLYTEKPDSNNQVILDFNKAYNPPCAFTKFATCPLPPKQNYLNLKITAGEKKYGKGHH